MPVILTTLQRRALSIRSAEAAALGFLPPVNSVLYPSNPTHQLELFEPHNRSAHLKPLPSGNHSD